MLAAVTVAAWVGGAFSGGYSSPVALARGYMEAYLARDAQALCDTLSPADIAQMEDVASSGATQVTCPALMAAHLASVPHDDTVKAADLTYVASHPAGDVVRVVVTRGGDTFDTVEARRDPATGRWFLDLALPELASER